MNQIMIPKFELSSLKHPSVINIVGAQSTNTTLTARKIINNLTSFSITTVFTNQAEDYKGLNNTTIYNDTLFLNKVVNNIIRDQQKYPKTSTLIIFDQIPSLYKNYYIIPQLLQISKSFNITTIIIDKCPEIPKQLFNYLDYSILTYSPKVSIQYKREFYKVYGQVLESYNQFYAIYKDICQENEEKSLLFDYTQEYYIPEKMLGWINQSTKHTKLTQVPKADHIHP